MLSRRSSSDDPAEPRPESENAEESDTRVEVTEPDEETDIALLEGFEDDMTE